MGVSGSVAYMFDHTATFGVEGKSVDEVLETLMEQDIDVRDVIDDNGLTIVQIYLLHQRLQYGQTYKLQNQISLHKFRMHYVKLALRNLK